MVLQQRKSDYGRERYEPIVENPFRSPAETQYAKSTFSIDVDTASYANVRRFLNQGTLPPPGAVRIEEMINYFDYDYPQPEGDKPFSVSMEVAECPWQPGHQLVRIGLKGKEIDSKERRPCNLVFLLDVSGSMSNQDKLPLLKRGLQMMLGQLTEADRVTIVTYAGDAGVKLEATSGDQTKKIAAAIESLQAGGSTNGSAGIQMAYKHAQQQFIKDGNNRVILATDGDLNVGVTDDNELVELIRKKAANGVFLTVLGFGTGNLQDAKLEKLADNGNGMYAYIDNLREARKVLVEQAMGTLVTIAKDVKIQVEFNPVEVASYRLIGYENRALANQDFNNDKRDAGDIGAGHTVTALYEIVPTKQADQPLANADEPLKYQRSKKQQVVRASFTEAAGSGELLTVWVRYKEPDGHESKKLEFVVKVSETKFNRSSKDLQFAASVAAFGMLLRNSEHCGNMTFAAIEEAAAGALGSDPKGHRTALLDLVRRASSLRPESGSIDQR
ncbi:MAG: VWA domain-containing protein [Planctomycetes bacterium]|nr:VWA domain-containing protein [Planctomycetota bacterium]